MNPQVFRQYDIRGVADRDFDDAFVEELGLAWATTLARGGKSRLGLGRDCRLSSDRLHRSLLEGLLRGGMEVVDVGVVPTPLLYFSIAHWKLDGGVMITGSHNAPDYNGFKLVFGQGAVFGSAIQELGSLIERRAFVQPATRGRHTPRSVLSDYRSHVLSQFRPCPGLKVAVDAGNGCAGPVAVPLMQALGLAVEPLYTEMDGRFPNHHPDPTVEANMRDLAAAVKRSAALVGIAYDGDADRIGVVDETGALVRGDELLAIFARALLAERPGATIIGDVKCSERLYTDIARHGGRPIMWKTGHSLIKHKMREENALLAGEMSGHIFFADRYYGFDDAIYASLRLIEILARQGEGPAALLADLPKTVNTPEIRVECPDERKFAVVQSVAELFRTRYKMVDIDGVRVAFPHGWGLVRASNTEPALVMRFEGDSPGALSQIRELFESAVKAAVKAA